MSFSRILRGVILFASTAIAVPYTLALVTNILYGWPQCSNKYKRALSPHKVLRLNYALYQTLRDQAKLAFLFLRWKRFYATADPQHVLKDIPYGRNECHLDLYVPNQKLNKSKRPVIIFIYGGTWSSGDKSMYGLLCSEIGAAANVITVCPDYSYYPKGYVDDMIQDVVDCITWVIENIDQYGGDDTKILLMGHSAGAHLCAMAILEMLHDECTSIQQSFKFKPVDHQLDELNFAESYYGSQFSSRTKGHEDSSGSSESFAVVSEYASSGENGSSIKLDGSQASGGLLSSTNSEGFTSLVVSSVIEPSDGIPKSDGTPQEAQGDADETSDINNSMNVLLEQETSSTPHSGSEGDDEEQDDDDSGDNDSIVTVKPKDIEGHMTLSEVSKSVQGFIGLAGVYSISDHFLHEYNRGVEDVSRMSRALYGVDHFDRFSPTQIVKRFGQFLSLPLMVLVHGTSDHTVPVSSTSRFADALAGISANVKVRILPNAPHYDVAMDLMDNKRTFHNHLMSIIMETVNSIS